MKQSFYQHPILNSPYKPPTRHWQLDDDGQPTQEILQGRRRVSLLTPVPSPRRTTSQQGQMVIEDGRGLSTEDQQYDITGYVNQIRALVDQWRRLPDSRNWGVTTHTERLLKHWRQYEFQGIRPFFCQVEAVETIIWLTEVAPKAHRSLLDRLEKLNEQANPQLVRWALKMATGTGKTTVMAMIIGWQTINAVRHARSDRFTKGFLVVTPGITIKDRLRVLKPNDPESYYTSRQLVPRGMLQDLDQAIVVVTNYHAFKQRERIDISKGTRALIQGRSGTQILARESEGEMIRRVMPEMMDMKNILVLNDEGHHCYREKPGDSEERKLVDEERSEAKKNAEAARLWISGIETIKRKQGVKRVIDLSATPFFLRGSGYAEGTLFPWTVSDFSLMDAIECGIVKLPRVPVSDNIPSTKMPQFRELWKHIRSKMPRTRRNLSQPADALQLPAELQTALEALYGHYKKTYESWQESDIEVPPCFIVVCNNTSTSKMVYDYISGFDRHSEDGDAEFHNGRLPLFRNYEADGSRIAKPRTILIDSRQLESGDALDTSFKKVAAQEIEAFRSEIQYRTGNREQADNISDQDLLREVVNTVGKPGRLGESVRCVVSVSMLTEGWDANNVTHILGVRAFGTQLLCEQVVGRALRRRSYDLNDDGLFDVEYADVMGVPFDFTAEPVYAPLKNPRKVTHVRAVSPERDELEIKFPRAAGYRVELPKDEISAHFNDDSVLELTPELIGPTETRNEGIIGEGADLNLIHTKSLRTAQIEFQLAKWLLYNYWTASYASPDLHLFGPLKRIVRQWIKECLICKGGAYPAQLMYMQVAQRACERIAAAIIRSKAGDNRIRMMLDPYNPTGSTSHVNFQTSKDIYRTDARKSHLNYVVLDSGWESEFCRILESHAKVKSYVKNHGLGFEVPYTSGSESRIYIPDFIVQVDYGNPGDDPLNLIVEIKGYRREDAKEKKSTMDTYWVPAVNNEQRFGKWSFAEFRDLFDMRERLDSELDSMIRRFDLRYAPM